MNLVNVDIFKNRMYLIFNPPPPNSRYTKISELRSLKSMTVNITVPVSNAIFFTTPSSDILFTTQYRVYDGILSAGLWACLIIGVPGNYLALKYFLISRKRNVSTLLYIIASSIDIISSLVHIPVAINLLNDRAGGLLGYTSFCSAWYFLLLILQLMSMFVAMLLALSRAIVILFPFCRINRKTVMASIFLMLVYQCAWNTVFLLLADYTYYSLPAALCFAYFSNTKTIFYLLYQINFNIWSILPPIVVLVSLLVSIIKLKRASSCGSKDSFKKSHCASVTIAYFSIIFLLCNSFSFINNTLYIITIKMFSYPGPIYESTFMFFYSWMLSFLFCMVANAALNPILYFLRIKKMRLWAIGRVGRTTVRRKGNGRYLPTQGSIVGSRAETEF